jgi:hypothetical protein
MSGGMVEHASTTSFVISLHLFNTTMSYCAKRQFFCNSMMVFPCSIPIRRVLPHLYLPLKHLHFNPYGSELWDLDYLQQSAASFLASPRTKGFDGRIRREVRISSHYLGIQ